MSFDTTVTLIDFLLGPKSLDFLETNLWKNFIFKISEIYDHDHDCALSAVIGAQYIKLQCC